MLGRACKVKPNLLFEQKGRDRLGGRRLEVSIRIIRVIIIEIIKNSKKVRIKDRTFQIIIFSKTFLLFCLLLRKIVRNHEAKNSFDSSARSPVSQETSYKRAFNETGESSAILLKENNRTSAWSNEVKRQLLTSTQYFRIKTLWIAL
jgi:hypothetical protein